MPDKAVTVKKLGRYDITRVLGKGAMGVVYEARDPNLNRKVAIKTVRVDSLSKEEAAEYELRFRTEAHSAARLQHPNIVSVYDSDRDGETAFLVMEFVKGEDLKHYLDGGKRYSLEQSVRMMRDLLAALEYAHQRKIIHRDIKPANLLIEADGRVKLTDFGVARIQDSGEATRTQGGMVGTLKYMSPEQVEGKTVDAASDLFSAGIVLYQLLTDRRPFDGDSYFSIVNQITNQQPPAPSTINQMLPVALDAVVARALAKNKLDRFATAQDFIFALQAAARRADPTITPMANPYKIIEHHNTGSMERSGSTASTLGNTGSTVTQELELVYWKDVKESADNVDLEGFLCRFPEGVYADLAKRRLKRMADAKAALGEDVYDRTMLVGPIDTPSSAAVAPAPLTAPVLASESNPQASADLPTALPPSDSESDQPMAPEGKKLAAAPAALELAASHDSASPVEPLKGSKGSKLWLLALAGAITLGGLWAWQSRGTQTDQPMITETSAEAGLSASAASVATGSTSTAVVLANATAAMALANTTGAVVSPLGGSASEPNAGGGSQGGSLAANPQAAASSPTLTALAIRAAAAAARLKAAREAASHSSTTASSTHRSQDTANASTAASSTSGSALAQGSRPKEAVNPSSAGPKEACEGRSLFGYGSCLYEQCERPVFKNHTYCVDQRERTERARTNR